MKKKYNVIFQRNVEIMGHTSERVLRYTAVMRENIIFYENQRKAKDIFNCDVKDDVKRDNKDSIFANEITDFYDKNEDMF